MGMVLFFFKAAWGWVTAAFKFLLEHPMVLVAIISFCVGMFGARYLSASKYERKLHDLETVIEQQKQKIDAVLQESASLASVNQKKAADLEAQLNSAVSDYEAKLAEAATKQKIKVVKVVVPGVSQPTDIIVENGLAACRRLPSSYRDKVNELVKQGEGSVK